MKMCLKSDKCTYTYIYICSTAVTERNYLKGKITFRPFYNSLPFSSVHMYLKTVRNYEKLCILVENNKPT